MERGWKNVDSGTDDGLLRLSAVRIVGAATRFCTKSSIVFSGGAATNGSGGRPNQWTTPRTGSVSPEHEREGGGGGD